MIEVKVVSNEAISLFHKLTKYVTNSVPGNAHSLSHLLCDAVNGGSLRGYLPSVRLNDQIDLGINSFGISQNCAKLNKMWLRRMRQRGMEKCFPGRFGIEKENAHFPLPFANSISSPVLAFSSRFAMGPGTASKSGTESGSGKWPNSEAIFRNSVKL